MRPKEISLNIRPINPEAGHSLDEAADEHLAPASYNTPLRPDAFEMSDEEKSNASNIISVKLCKCWGLTLPMTA